MSACRGLWRLRTWLQRGRAPGGAELFASCSVGVQMPSLQRGRAPGGAELRRMAEGATEEDPQLQRGRAPGGAEFKRDD